MTVPLRTSLTLPVHSPKRTQPEPGECKRKANGDSDAPRPNLSGVILAVLFERGAAQAERHHQKENSGHLQPKFVEHVAERPQGRPGGSHDGVKRTAAARLLSGNPRYNPRFSPSRDFAHASILAACDDTMSQLPVPANRSSLWGI
jgi:hypothetical protein